LPMSPKPFALKAGAVFIADAHYSFKHPALITMLQAVESKKLACSQLILMGDIFDLLFTDITVTLERNREVIAIINRLSAVMEVLYLEGNHDFNLVDIFPNVTVCALSNQPVDALWQQQRIGLAHGDFAGERGYRFYTALIRNRTVQKILNIINMLSGAFITDKLDEKLKNKDDCRRIDDFETYVKRHLEAVDLDAYDYFVEGHYHQNRRLKIQKCHYSNLAAFACNEIYYVLEAGTEVFTLHEKKFQVA